MENRRNVEIKARLHSIDAAREIAARIATKPLKVLHQVDTYFFCSHGRLKLRETQGEFSQLVWYDRCDVESAKTSNYQLVDVANPAALKAALAAAHGVRCVVDKRRELYLWKNVRIHLDSVVDLGNFLEFEAVLDPDDSEEQGSAQVENLLAQFAIETRDLLAGSYSELLGANPPGQDDGPK